jgi:leader peptidase (prepilin peptidase)/N-methyltransferase
VHIFFVVEAPERGHGRRVAGRSTALSIALLLKSSALLIVPAGAAVAASIVAAPGARGGLGAGLALLMLAIAVIDARHFIIPDSLNATGLVLGFLHAALQGEGDVASALAMAALRGAILGLIFYVLRALYLRMRGRQGIGLGDVKLAAVAGAWLGWIAVPIAIEIAALSALAVYATRHFILRRPVSATTRLPFGLFFAPAIWLGWLLQATVLPPY